MKIERFFNEQARARVAEAVKAAEARTSGQIIPVVVASSRPYRGWLFLSALAIGFLAVVGRLGLDLIFPTWPASPAQELAWALLAAAMAFGLLSVPVFARLFLGGHLEGAVRSRAMLAFLEHGVHRTHEENGVLLFASIFERKVVVLGDRAVHAKLGDEHWKRAVDTLVAGIRAGDPALGFCDAIGAISEEMAKAFPREGAPPPNELPDELQVDR